MAFNKDAEWGTTVNRTRDALAGMHQHTQTNSKDVHDALGTVNKTRSKKSPPKTTLGSMRQGRG